MYETAGHIVIESQRPRPSLASSYANGLLCLRLVKLLIRRGGTHQTKVESTPSIGRESINHRSSPTGEFVLRPLLPVVGILPRFWGAGITGGAGRDRGACERASTSGTGQLSPVGFQVRRGRSERAFTTPSATRGKYRNRLQNR